MGTRYHSVGLGNGTPRTLEGKLRQLKSKLATAEHELSFAWSKVDIEGFTNQMEQSIVGLKESIKQVESELKAN